MDTNAHDASHISHRSQASSARSPHIRITPPRLRTFVLVFSVVSLLALIALATPLGLDPASRQAAAQTTLIDYDTDGDNLIEVSTRAQWAAIDHDRDGNGSPTATGTTAWQTAFPDAMANAGCASTCEGYELTTDLDFDGETFTPIGNQSSGSGYAATFDGNGFQIHNPTLSSSFMGIFLGTEPTAVIRGLGVIDPSFTSSVLDAEAGGIVTFHRGKLIGSYVVGHSDITASVSGGLVASAYSTSTVAHSYSRININAGSQAAALSLGGIIGWVSSGGATCISSYSHGNISGSSSVSVSTGVVFGLEVGTPTNTGCTGAGDVLGTTTGSIANMRAAISYDDPSSNNPFSTWDNTDEDGNSRTVDYWDFVGPHDTPVLKAFGQTRNRQAMDYDMDDDGWIDIRTREQWAAMDEDRAAPYGIPESGQTYLSPAAYRDAFPGAMRNMGCLYDHDNMDSTPKQLTCIGYELLNDINFQELDGYEYATIPSFPVDTHDNVPHVNIDVKGNGYRLVELYYHNGRNGSARGSGIFAGIDGTIEGLGVWNSRIFNSGRALGGVITGSIGWGGKVVGSYTYLDPRRGSIAGGNQWGALVGRTRGENAGNPAVLENSFSRAQVGYSGGDNNAGLFGFFGQHAYCRNSYFAGTFGNNHGGTRRSTSWAGQNEQHITDNARRTGCFGNSDDWLGEGTGIYTGNSAYNTAGWHETWQEMITPTGYTFPYAAYNTNRAGESQDVWDFGDETELPVLKGYGHDRKFPRYRLVSGTGTVNLCERTLAVANEIIRHLKNDTWRTTNPPITARPAAIDSLSPCINSESTQEVSVNNLRDFVVTTADNPFNLNPGRTTPASPQLTELKRDDLDYIPNANHLDFSDNALTTLPYYLFQDIKIRQLDLSNNALTSLPLDTFSGQPGTAVESSTVPFAYYDSWIDLSGNRLTTEGIPYRLFDEMPYLTGLSLNSNAITEINTRWFDNLTHLGRLDPDATSLPRILGLHLGGNEVTGHYYYNKAFPATLRQYEVTYSGANAGNDLRNAIVTRIMEPKGLRKPDLANTEHLNIETTANLQNAMITTGACPEDIVSGPAGYDGLNDTPIPCQEATRWTPPWAEGTSAAQVAAPSTSSVGEDGHVVISFSHRSPGRGELPITAYQIRYRLLPDDLDDPWGGEWRTIPVDRSFGRKSTTLTVLMPLNFYQFQMRAIFAGTPSAPVTFAQGTWPEGLEGATAQQPLAESGRRSVRVTFTHEPITDPDPDRAAALAITGYQLRYRPVTSDPDDPWTRDWYDIEVDLSTPGPKSVIVEPLLEGVRYEFQIRPVSAGPVESVTVTQSTVLGLPKANAIRPTIREIAVRAGQQVRLEVDVISLQDTVLNDLADDSDSVMVFRWTESPSGGGTFATPSSDRRVVYTAPDLPGTYTILAEAQPDGICRDHHNAKLGISAEDRARCIATITVRVSRAPGAIEPEADPINPAGLIPTSLTDSAGTAYAVFTPVDGGTFSGEGITISAPAGAIPDQQLLGVAAARSDIPVPTPFPGARLTIAAPYYTVNGVQRTGDAPVSGYTLDDPIRACMPIPPMFRADISDVAVVARAQSDGSITILTSSIRQTPTGLAACGNIGQLPATVAVANIGVIQATPEPPAPEEDLPDTGATAPGPWAVALIMLAALAVLVATGIVRTHRNPSARRRAGTASEHDT